MKVDFFNFGYASEYIRIGWRGAISDAINEGIYIGGNQVQNFEKEFAIKSGLNFAIGVSNGFDGLELALRALDIGHGDLVAVPAHTFIATWNAVIACGAIPVGVEVGDDAQMDLNFLERILADKRISCVIPVHMHGHVVNLEELFELKMQFKFKVIEDASQAHFAFRNYRKVGSISDIAVFSLYPTKNLGAIGDAGIAITNDVEVAKKIRKLSNYGADTIQKYFHNELGFNRRLDAIQAAVLNFNLKYIDEWNETRRRLAETYSIACHELGISHLKGRPGSVWHHFCIFTEKRSELIEFLSLNGIGTEIHYPRLASNEVADFLRIEKSHFPKAEEIARTILSIPLSQFHTEEMIEYVVSVLCKAKKMELV